MAIRPGYMGYLEFAATGATAFKIWVTDSTITSSQDFIQPDLAQGNYDRIAFASGTFENSASFSGPVGSGIAPLISGAMGRNACGEIREYDVTAVLACGGPKRTITAAKINNLSLTVSAGDIATFSCDVLGGSITEDTVVTSGGITITECGGLTTWRDFSLDCDQAQSLEISCANNLEYIWSMSSGTGNDNGGNVVVIEGIRTVTGSFSSYGETSPTCVESGTALPFGGTTITMGDEIRYLSTDTAQSASPFVATRNWQSFCELTGGVWSYT